MPRTRELTIVKYGSDSVTNAYGIDNERIASHVNRLLEPNPDASELFFPEVIIVSSGSVAVGKALYEQHGDLEITEPDPQNIAMLGSGRAFSAWQNAFLKHNILAAQLLVTHHELDDFNEGSVLERVLERNLTYGWVTVANENDALSKEELREIKRQADNDRLAAHIAMRMGATALYFLTGEVEGLHDEHDVLIPEVTKDNAEDALEVAGEPANKGRGGMKSKVKWALEAAAVGIATYIGHADTPFPDLLVGNTGTYFEPQA